MKKVSGILIFLATFAIFGISVESFAKTERFFSSQVNQPPSFSTIEEYRAVYDALGGSSESWTIFDPSSPREARFIIKNVRTRIANYRKIFGSGDQTWTGIAWTGSYNNLQTSEKNTPKLTEALLLYEQASNEITRLKTDYLARGGDANAWTGTYDDPLAEYDETTPTLSEAQNLHNELVAEIQRLKTDYLARGGKADDWTGSFDNPDTPDGVNTPTLSEAQTLHGEFVAEIQELKTNYLARGGKANDWTGSYQGTPTLSEAQALVQLLKQSKSSHSPSSNNHTLIIGVSVGVGGALLLGGLGYWFYRRRQKVSFLP